MNQEGNALLGFTTQREAWAKNGFMSLVDGEYVAWWQSPEFTGGYPGPIPIEDVNTRMLNWTPQECEVAVKVYVTEGDYEDEDEAGHYRWVIDTERKAIVRPGSDTGRDAIFSYFGRDSYQVHDYSDIIQQCSNIADDELGIASAFLMDQGAIFVINMELPEDIITNTGIAHRVRMMAWSSQNGKHASNWKIVDEFCVCSNSFSLNLGGEGNTFKVKHTGKSLGKIQTAREALGLVYQAAEEYTDFLDAMTKVDVTDAQFRAIVNGMFPMPVPEIVGTKTTNQAALTRVDNRRTSVLGMWNSDKAVQPWNGTLFGALQAWSTWNQHERPRTDALASSIQGSMSDKIALADQEFFQIVEGLDLDLSALTELAS